MNFVRSAVDLVEQALQVNRAAGARGGDDEFHKLQIPTSNIQRMAEIPNPKFQGCWNLALPLLQVA
jgi:hypothetical protein